MVGDYIRRAILIILCLDNVLFGLGVIAYVILGGKHHDQ
jgi:hypothetical protein